MQCNKICSEHNIWKAACGVTYVYCTRDIPCVRYVWYKIHGFSTVHNNRTQTDEFEVA